MTGREIALEFTEMFDDLDSADINTMLAKNVSMEMLEFFASYADQFAEECSANGLELERRARSPAEPADHRLHHPRARRATHLARSARYSSAGPYRSRAAALPPSGSTPTDPGCTRPPRRAGASTTLPLSGFVEPSSTTFTANSGGLRERDQRLQQRRAGRDRELAALLSRRRSRRPSAPRVSDSSVRVDPARELRQAALELAREELLAQQVASARCARKWSALDHRHVVDHLPLEVPAARAPARLRRGRRATR